MKCLLSVCLLCFLQVRLKAAFCGSLDVFHVNIEFSVVLSQSRKSYMLNGSNLPCCLVYSVCLSRNLWSREKVSGCDLELVVSYHSERQTLRLRALTTKDNLL